ncbi:C39 family peptidase [Nonomuraea ferruginea]
MAVDTFVARRPVTAYRVRVRACGAGARVDGLAVMASALPPHPSGSPPSGREPVELDVPAFWQHAHAGHHPEYDGGGANWCGPAATSMVLAYWGRGPDDLGWVGGGCPHPAVDHAARGTYDRSYLGTGNWPFNVAYAGSYGLRGFVTRLRSAAELERFARAGIPVVVSLSFKERELPGSGYSTSGNLMVVTGFTAAAATCGSTTRPCPTAGCGGCIRGRRSSACGSGVPAAAASRTSCTHPRCPCPSPMAIGET